MSSLDNFILWTVTFKSTTIHIELMLRYHGNSGHKNILQCFVRLSLSVMLIEVADYRVANWGFLFGRGWRLFVLWHSSVQFSSESHTTLSVTSVLPIGDTSPGNTIATSLTSRTGGYRLWSVESHGFQSRFHNVKGKCRLTMFKVAVKYRRPNITGEQITSPSSELHYIVFATPLLIINFRVME